MPSHLARIPEGFAADADRFVLFGADAVGSFRGARWRHCEQLLALAQQRPGGAADGGAHCERAAAPEGVRARAVALRVRGARVAAVAGAAPQRRHGGARGVGAQHGAGERERAGNEDGGATHRGGGARKKRAYKAQVPMVLRRWRAVTSTHATHAMRTGYWR